LPKEISWLHFNERVLQETSTPSNPLLERLKSWVKALNLNESTWAIATGGNIGKLKELANESTGHILSRKGLKETLLLCRQARFMRLC